MISHLLEAQTPSLEAASEFDNSRFSLGGV